MKFDIITILPEAFDSYLNSSLLARAQGKELLDVKTQMTVVGGKVVYAQ